MKAVTIKGWLTDYFGDVEFWRDEPVLHIASQEWCSTIDETPLYFGNATFDLAHGSIRRAEITIKEIE